MSYVIGVDSSTTATKAVVWDREGRAVSEGRQEFELAIPHPGWHEQDAQDWWRSTATALREAANGVKASEIEAIGLTHQRETFACLGEDEAPLRPAILWLDARAVREVEEHGNEEVHRISGKPPDTTPAFYKLLWLRENEPEVLERTARMVDVHGFLVKQLTGQWRTAYACADPLGLIDMSTFDWSEELLGKVGLQRSQLCGLGAPGDVMGELLPEVAEELGIPAGIPVVGGAGDGQPAGLGANITEPGRAYLNLGTAVVSGTYSEAYAWGREFRTLCGPLPKTYTLETLLQGGTYTVSWFVDKLAGTEASRLGLELSDEDVLEAAAARLEPGADGLLAVPYWNQAQTPHWDDYARGVLLGFRGHHGKAHIFRAILEGVAFEQRLLTDGLATARDQPIDLYLAVGGGSRSSLWCQIIADITGRTVTACQEAETTSLGAGMHAAAAVGWFDSLGDAAQGMSSEGATYEPDERRAKRYAKLLEVYREIYPRVSELFPRLNAAVEEG
ncbi:MAG: FGGY-family carbohydrate kinase [Solirubrobacterales bacterium]|nr:FGGY-family carbohydrate kinase [Solirubrobacterales bacterium]